VLSGIGEARVTAARVGPDIAIKLHLPLAWALRDPDMIAWTHGIEKWGEDEPPATRAPAAVAGPIAKATRRSGARILSDARAPRWPRGAQAA
jgi:hypothetical protein